MQVVQIYIKEVGKIVHIHVRITIIYKLIIIIGQCRLILTATLALCGM